jgi:PAS domain S-box-containing protein
MKDKDKTHKQLITELTQLRQRIAELEATGRKRNQFEKSLRTERDKAQQYLDIAEVMLVVLDKKGSITLLNRKGNQILGYKEGELIGKNWFTTCLPTHLRKGVKGVFKKLMAGEGKQTEFYENPVLTKSGTERIIAWHNTVLQDTQGTIIGTLSSGEDITERKKAEEEIERLASFPQLNPMPIVEVDKKGQPTYTNPAAQQIFPDLEKKQGKHPFLDGLKSYFSELQKTPQKYLFREIEVDSGWYSQIISLADPEHIRIYAADITERKQAEDALREGEERFHRVVETMKVGLGTIDKNGVLTYVNEYLAKMLGYSIDEMIGRATLDFYYDEEMRKAQEEIFKKRRAGMRDPTPYEVTWRRKDGQKVYAILSPTPMCDADGHYTGSFAIHTDITEHKRMEETLRESEEKYRAMFETAPVSIILLDKDGVIIDVSPYHYSHIGKGKVKRKDLVGKSILNHPTIVNAGLSEIYGRLFQGESFEQNNVYFPVLLPGGDGYFNVRGTPILRDGEVIGAVIMHEDITERKQAEDELRESKERFKIAAQSASDLVWEWDIPNGRLQWFGAIDELLGYAPGKFPRTIEAWEKHIHSDDHDRVMAALDQHLNDQTPYEKEYRVRRKDGTYRYWIDRGTARRDSKGNPLKMVGVCTDITERKRTEQELQESEERFRLAFESANTGVCLVDPEGNLTRVNSKMCEIFGYTKKELESMTVNDIAHPKNIDTSPTFMQKTLQGEIDRGTFEKRYIHKKGHVVICEVSSSLVRNAEGTPLYFISHVHDISARKQAEEALQHSYQQMQDMLVTTVNALASTVEMKDQYTAGHQPRVAQLACAIAEEMGLPEEQIEGIRMAGLIHDIGKIMVPAEILNKPGPLTEIQYEMVRMHPRAAFDILKGIKFPWPVAEAVLQHQELMDGSGYPQGLSGKEILLEARILAVANAVEAMVSHRPYRAAYDIKEALAEISKNKGTLYDPAVVDACLKLFAEKRFTFDELL